MILKRRPSRIDICYLCGRTLEGATPDRDHVPPNRWFAKSFRLGFPPQLVTLPVHPTCQDAFEGDEVYFFNSLLPLAAGSPAADEALKDLAASFKYPEQRGLGLQVLSEFGKVVAADGTLLKSYQPSRVNRVVWKVVRGLFFVEHDGRVLPEGTPKTIRIVAPLEAPHKLPPEFEFVRDTESKGRYTGVFDYKYLRVEDPADPSLVLHYWALLLWERFVVIVAFHDPACVCPTCTEDAP